MRGSAGKSHVAVTITLDLILSFFSPIFRMQFVSTVLIHHVKPLLLIMKRNLYPLLKVMPDRYFLPRDPLYAENGNIMLIAFLRIC